MSQTITAGELGPQHLGSPVHLPGMGDRPPVPLAGVSHTLLSEYCRTGAPTWVPGSHWTRLTFTDGSAASVTPNHSITVHEEGTQ